MRVIAQVQVPTKLSQRQRELFEQLSDELGEAQSEKGFFDRVKEAFGG